MASPMVFVEADDMTEDMVSSVKADRKMKKDPASAGAASWGMMIFTHIRRKELPDTRAASSAAALMDTMADARFLICTII